LNEALRHWRKVRDLVGRLPESPETILLGLLSRAGMIGLGIWQGDPQNQAATLFEEGRALATRLGDARALALLEAAYSGALSSAGEIEAAIEHSLEGVRLAATTGAKDVQLALQVPLVYAYEIAGRIEEALALTEEAIAEPPEDLKLGASALGFSPYAFLVLFRGELLTHVGRLTEAREQLEEALDVAERLEEPEITGLAHGFFCYFGRCSGDVEIARRHAPDAVAIAERIGSALSRTFAYRGLGLARMMSGEWTEAAAAFEKALEIARESRTVLWSRSFTLADLAEVYARLGRADDARATIEEALSAAREVPSKNVRCHAKLALARVRLILDGAAAAGEIEAALDDAIAHARATYVPQVHAAYAEIAAMSGDSERHERELRTALALFTEIGATGYARATARELATVAGRAVEAPA